MSSNRILKSELFSTITKSGKQIALGVATETQEWKRPRETAHAQDSSFESAVLNDSASLPAGTAELIQRGDKIGTCDVYADVRREFDERSEGAERECLDGHVDGECEDGEEWECEE